MFWFWFILYVAVGSAATFFYKYECMKDYDSRWNDHEDDTAAAVFSGIFWPVVAPITFALLFAKKYANQNKRR